MYNCVEMRTVLVSDVINKYNLPLPNSIPDHSILSSKFVTSFFELGKNYENSLSGKNWQNESKKQPRKNLSKIDRNFMMSSETLELVLQAITKLERRVETKKEIDNLWSEVKQIILAEMQKLPDIPRSNIKKQKQKFRKSKPFWNQELETLWNDCCKAEKAYLKFKVQNNADF